MHGQWPRRRAHVQRQDKSIQLAQKDARQARKSRGWFLHDRCAQSPEIEEHGCVPLGSRDRDHLWIHGLTKNMRGTCLMRVTLTCYEFRGVFINQRGHRGHGKYRDKRFAVYEGRRADDLREQNSVGYAQHHGAPIRVATRIHIQRLGLTHEHITLIHIDVEDILTVNVDRLHERTCAHVVQKRTLAARADESRVCEPVRARERGERQLGPGPKLPARRIFMVYRREKFACAYLLLVRRCVGCHLADGTVAGQAPDFLLAITAIVDEISVFVLAVGRGTNDNRLQTRGESLVSQRTM